MAKPREREDNPGSAGQGNLPQANVGPGGLLGRLGTALLPRRRNADASATPAKGAAASAGNQRNGATPATPASPRQRSGLSQFLFGAMIYILGTYLLQIPLILVNGYFNLHWDRTVVYHFPKGFPLIGGSNLTVISLIYFVLLILMLWALYRFNILPRDPFGVQARAAAQRTTTTPTAAGATPTATHRRSAALRRARRASQTTSASNGGSAKTAVTAPKTRGPATPTAATTVRAGDEAYERVKALQRTRRRRK
jgi:hypothetical protein